MKRILIDTYSVTDRLERAYAFAVGEAREAFREALEIVLDAPEVAAQEVEHGEWQGFTHSRFCGTDKLGDPIYRDGEIYYCSKCRWRTVIKWKYCPNCGAKMDGEA